MPEPENAAIHEPRCNTYCTPGTHHLASGLGYPHLHRTDLAGECAECAGWHDQMRPGDDCGGTPDWCLAPNGVECAQHDENGDRRG